MIVDQVETPSDKSVTKSDKSVISVTESVIKSDKSVKSVTESVKSVKSEEIDLIGDVTAWPSLSESTRFPKSPSLLTYAPVVSDSPPNHRQPTTNPSRIPNPNFSSNPNRAKLSNRGGSSRGGPSRGGYVRHPPPPQQQLPPPFYGFEQGPIRGGPFFYGPQPQHSPLLRGHHYNGGPIRPGFHPRDVGFPRAGPPMMPMVPFPFIAPMLPPEPFIAIPHYTAAHRPVPLPPHLDTKLLNQINYYFSDENLVKDMYLRSQMDEGGWVPVALIANFNKVRELTQDIHLILESLGTSAVVEVQGNKIRRRNDWRRWIPTTTTSPQETATGLNTIRAVAV